MAVLRVYITEHYSVTLQRYIGYQSDIIHRFRLRDHVYSPLFRRFEQFAVSPCLEAESANRRERRIIPLKDEYKSPAAWKQSRSDATTREEGIPYIPTDDCARGLGDQIYPSRVFCNPSMRTLPGNIERRSAHGCALHLVYIYDAISLYYYSL